MSRLEKISRIYFIGIGGIGMSALARYFSSNGVTVSGYDRTATALSKQLEEEGMAVHYTDDINLLDRDAGLVIYTPAIPADHKEFNYFRLNNYMMMKRSEVLGEITSGSYNICVAGTHGKTTISAMIAHILRDSGYGCNAFLGGVTVNYDTNFWAVEGGRKVSVVEADEYDRSFLQLQPDIAIISAMDADHLDIYGTEEKMQQAFVDFSHKIKPGGLLLSKFGLEKEKALQAPVHLRYSLQNEGADVYASNITMQHGTYLFDVVGAHWTLNNLVLNMGGMHNVENVVAAISVAHHLQVSPEKIREAVAKFKGVKRRFEYVIPPSSKQVAGGEVIYIDDYAHHPEELKALVNGARTLFNGMRILVIFQPHLYSRTRDLAAGFAAALDLADEVILLPIYPARELPVEGISSEMIANEMRTRNKQVRTKEEILEYLPGAELKDTIVITAGAGDIDTMVRPIKNIIEKR